MSARILLAEDDQKQAHLIRVYLERAGHSVLACADGRTALELARSRRPDLIVLDVMMPEVDGLDVCRILRAESKVPILMLTARSTESDLLLGLDLGADDYMVKPFSPAELTARVRALLRRAADRTAPELITVGELEIDPTRYTVRLRGELVELTAKEFDILHALAQQPGVPLTRAQILERAFGFDNHVLERTVDAHVKNLRRKVEDDPARPRYLLTVSGRGYKLAEDAG
ncbi:response regulator transcription factor [Crossiella sp. CA-258035]|uniref:response regulator transcription factor n=1 Tax=Crossiella sp. CA-258035 TaxID=2981138 RepID=UPI0024BD13CC|nr:response regulator transcription factor [Crossiella sp. CA-258035]WHT20599.1 response regulator transcription factor [Crossiella sp. CA-258035]